LKKIVTWKFHHKKWTFSFLRFEDNPEWKNKNVVYDFERSLSYLIENEEDIFKFEEE